MITMAAARKLDQRYGGNRMGRHQSVPATGVGWGGHTISKSFTQLAWENPDDMNRTPQQSEHLGVPMGTTNTFVKEKYVGTGHGVPPTRTVSYVDATAPGFEKTKAFQGMKQWNTIDLSTGATDHRLITPAKGTQDISRGYSVGIGDMSKPFAMETKDLRRDDSRRMVEAHVDVHRNGEFGVPENRRDEGINDVYKERARDISIYNRDVSDDQNSDRYSSPVMTSTTDRRQMFRQTYTTSTDRPIEAARDSRMVHEAVTRTPPPTHRSAITMGTLERRPDIKETQSVTIHDYQTARDVPEPLSLAERAPEGTWQTHWKIKDSPVPGVNNQ